MPNIEELRFIAKLLREKHEQWSKLPVHEEVFGSLPDPVAIHFDMSHWQRSTPFHCGFAGCAIGTYIEFASERAKLIGMEMQESTNSYCWPRVKAPVYEGHRGMAAVEEALGLDMNTAEYLFAPSGYPTARLHDPLYVADRIDAFCNRHEQQATTNV